jgi:hypothetical protein
MRARDVINRALQLIGVLDATEVADGNDMMVSLSTLNDMLDTWSTERLSILASVLETFPLVPGTATYTIGPTGDFATSVPVEILDQSFTTQNAVDFPLAMITEAQYNGISVKSAQGIPSALFYRPGAALGTLKLWRVPIAGVPQTISLASWKPIAEFADLDTDYAFAPGYRRALQYNLAVELEEVFARPPSVKVQKIARSSRKALQRVNAVVPRLGIDPALQTGPMMPEVIR